MGSTINLWVSTSEAVMKLLLLAVGIPVFLFICYLLYTRGNAVTEATVDGKPVTIGLNAYIKP